MTLKELSKMRKSELLAMAKKLKLKGFSRLTKSELTEKLVDFISKGGDLLKEKAEDLLKSVKLGTIVKSKSKKGKTSASAKANNAESKSSSPKKATSKAKAGGSVKISSSKRSTPSMKVLKVVGIPEPTPDSLAPETPADKEFLARKSVESLRYTDAPLYNQGELITPEELRDIDKDLPDLPLGYGDGSIHLMPRDPRWLFCYWDINEELRIHSGKHSQGTIYLKLHDVTHIIFDGTNSWSSHKFRLNEEARFWYIPVPTEGRQFIAEIGYSFPDGSWKSVGFSDGVIPPPSSKSPWVHDVFISLPFDKPLPLSSGDEFSSWLKVDRPHFQHGDSQGVKGVSGQKEDHKGSIIPQIPLFGTPTEPEPYFAMEGTVTSPGPRGVSSFVHIKDDTGIVESFPLTVEGDLRVFGATHPNVSLTIDGKTTEVNSDGTFNVTIPLPGKNMTHKVIARGEKGKVYSISISIERNKNS